MKKPIFAIYPASLASGAVQVKTPQFKTAGLGGKAVLLLQYVVALGIELTPEDRHHDRVVESAVPVDVLAENAFADIAGSLVGLECTDITCRQTQMNLVQVQPVEAIKRQELGHFGSKSAAPGLCVADQNAELSAPRSRMKVVQASESDGLAAFLQANHENDAIGRINLRLDECTYLLHGHRELAVEHVVRDLGVV